MQNPATVMQIDTLFEQAKLPDGSMAAIAVANGRIAAIERDPTKCPPAAERVNLAGALVIPGLIDGHIHLDTSFIGDTWKPHRPCTAGFNVHERVRFQKELLATAAPMASRTRALIELCVAQGTTHMRGHVNVDAEVGMAPLETVLAVREEYRDLVEIQLVAFPQNGVIACPGTAELLDAAVANGCDVVGGIDPATIDRDIEGQLDVVFGIAERRGVDIDIHLHEPHMLGVFQLEQIASRTRALGMQGHVAVSHAYGLGEVSLDIARRTAATLAASGVAIMSNAPGDRPFPPIAELSKAGVVVFSGNDNIRDSWWPYGNGDMLGRAMIVGYRSGFYTDDELGMALDLATGNGAKVLRLPGYGLAVGANADFVALAAEHIQEAVASVAAVRSVYKKGRLVAQNGALALR
jgi:cytosine/adenosine deaminase-related metal-dependent hydrolase